MTIHSGHPFPTPDDPVRRLRGRLGGTVSLWTAGDDAERAGLTVTSWLVAGGEPGRVLALLDPDADLTELLLETGPPHEREAVRDAGEHRVGALVDRQPGHLADRDLAAEPRAGLQHDDLGARPLLPHLERRCEARDTPTDHHDTHLASVGRPRRSSCRARGPQRGTSVTEPRRTAGNRGGRGRVTPAPARSPRALHTSPGGS